MGCTASRHLGKHASMEGCPSSPATANPQNASTYSTDYSVEYHHHFVALTSSSYGLLKVGPPSSKPVEPNNRDKSRIASLNEMYDQLRSLELGETANTSPWPCDTFKSPSGGDLSCSPSAHRREWCIDSAQFVISEAINVRELMMGFEEEALPQGTPHVRQASSIVVSPAQRGPLVSRQCTIKPFHTVEEVDVLKKSGEVSQNALDEEEYESGKENSLPEQRQHSMLAPPTRCPLNNTPLSQISQSSLKLKEAHKRGVPSIIKSSSKTSMSPSTSRAMKNATPKHGKVEHTLRNKQHQRSAVVFPPLVVSSTTSMSRRVVVRESILSSDPSSPLFDPGMVASYEKALKTISEDSWNACLVSPEVDRQQTLASIHREKNLLDIGNLEPPEDVEQKTHNVLELECFEEKCPPGGDATVVLYTTTLRGIRKTFEDCNKLRSILQSYGLSIDERDVSMHLEFLNELRKLMDRVVCVPRLFIKGRYIGGVEEVAKLHENGKLNELVEGLPREANAGMCDGCDGIRFVPCLECRGSCKVRLEDNKVQRCPDCNENGLIQCPICT